MYPPNVDSLQTNTHYVLLEPGRKLVRDRLNHRRVHKITTEEYKAESPT